MPKKKSLASINTNDITGWKVKEPVALPIPNIKGQRRVDLDPEKFEALIKSKGVRVKVYRTSFCPNVKSIDGGEHEIDCTLCNKSGFLDIRPIETLAFLQTQQLEKMFMPEGYVDGNSVLATFPIGIELQYFTKVELMDFTEIFYERVKRSQGDIDVLKYKAHRVNFLMDKNGKEYFEGNDFCLDPNGNIKWHPNKGPDAFTIYTIHYEAAVQFRATRAMHVNRFTTVPEDGKAKQMKLQEQWMLQKEFLVKRLDKNGNEILPNLIHEPDED